MTQIAKNEKKPNVLISQKTPEEIEKIFNETEKSFAGLRTLLGNPELNENWFCALIDFFKAEEWDDPTEHKMAIEYAESHIYGDEKWDREAWDARAEIAPKPEDPRGHLIEILEASPNFDAEDVDPEMDRIRYWLENGKNAKGLFVSCVPIISEKIPALVSDFSEKLQYLCLENLELTSEHSIWTDGLAKPEEFPNLEVLELGWGFIDEEAMVNLITGKVSKFPALKSLTLAQNAIENNTVDFEDLEGLDPADPNIPDLNCLDMYANAFTIKGWSNLLRLFPNLTYLDARFGSEYDVDTNELRQESNNAFFDLLSTQRLEKVQDFLWGDRVGFANLELIDRIKELPFWKSGALKNVTWFLRADTDLSERMEGARKLVDLRIEDGETGEERPLTTHLFFDETVFAKEPYKAEMTDEEWDAAFKANLETVLEEVGKENFGSSSATDAEKEELKNKALERAKENYTELINAHKELRFSFDADKE